MLEDFLSLFEEPQAISKIALGGLLAFIPIFNFTLLGFLGLYAQQTLENADYHLPKWGDWVALFRQGWRVFVLFLLVLSPTILMILLGALSLYFPFHSTLQSGGFGYLGHWLFSIFFLMLAILLAGFCLSVLPLCLFRWIESHDLLWSVAPLELIKDLAGMGWDYTENILICFGLFFVGETLFIMIAVLLFASPLWSVIGILFWAWSTLSLKFLLSVLAVKMNASLYSELRYRY